MNQDIQVTKQQWYLINEEIEINEEKQITIKMSLYIMNLAIISKYKTQKLLKKNNFIALCACDYADRGLN